MDDLNERVAVVTGAGSGIGRGMALAFAESGMKVVVADIDHAAAEGVVAELTAAGSEAIAHRVDVADRASVKALADASFARYGAVHVLCNNAGVTTFKAMDELTSADWDWVLAVNLYGVVHGIEAFLPRMKKQEDESHVVNTASTAGLGALPNLGPYVASKYAVVGITEALRMESARWRLSCSVLCPGNVNTGIVSSGRNRQGDFGGPSDETNALIQGAIDQGEDPEAVGRIVRQGVLDDDLYIFTHEESGVAAQNRYDAIMAAQEKANKRMAADSQTARR